MTSAYQLLPYKASEKYIVVQKPDKIGPEDCNDEFDYIKNNLKMIGTDNTTIPSTVKEAFLNKSSTFMEGIYNSSGVGDISSSAINLVDSYAIAGTGKTTIKKTVHDSNGECIEDLTFDFTHGDGTVPEWSSNINGLIPTKRYNLEHTELVSDPEVLAKVKDMLNGEKAEYNYSPLEESNENIVLRFAAQTDVSISDGNETLTNIDSKQNADTDLAYVYSAFLGAFIVIPGLIGVVVAWVIYRIFKNSRP